MPRLTLSNNISKIYDRKHVVLLNEAFASGTGGFTGTNATLSNDSGTLKSQADATNGYAYIEMATFPSKTYSYSIDLAAVQPGGGKIYVGTTAGDNSLINVTAASATTYTGTFKSTQKSLFLSLVTVTNGRFIKWDNITIEENN